MKAPISIPRMGGGEPVFTHLSIGLPKYPPAWAGMNLFHHQNTGSARRIPRMCGDEPHIMKVYRVRKPYSQSVKFKHFLCADALCKSSINLLTNQLNIVSVWMDKIERIYSPCVRRDAP